MRLKFATIFRYRERGGDARGATRSPRDKTSCPHGFCSSEEKFQISIGYVLFAFLDSAFPSYDRMAYWYLFSGSVALAAGEGRGEERICCSHLARRKFLLLIGWTPFCFYQLTLRLRIPDAAVIRISRNVGSSSGGFFFPPSLQILVIRGIIHRFIFACGIHRRENKRVVFHFAPEERLLGEGGNNRVANDLVIDIQLETARWNFFFFFSIIYWRGPMSSRWQ